MTLNQVIKRVREIVLAHRQIRNFYYGTASEFLTDHTTRYPSAFLMDTPGSLELSGKVRTIGFELSFFDLVNVSQDTKANEQDVLSDMLSIAEDIVAEFNHSSYTDWKLGVSVPVTLAKQRFNDVVAGAVVNLTITTPYTQDVCAVPTDELPIPNTEDMKLLFDEKYVATGDEGTTLIIPAIAGKKVVLVTRESAVLYRTSSSPDSTEYTWDGAALGLAFEAGPGERFLILYRTF